MTPAERFTTVVAHVACFVACLALMAIFFTALLAPDQDHGVPAHVIAGRP